MCEHNKIYYLGNLSAYCRDCKTKLDLDREWRKNYKELRTVNDYQRNK